VEVPKIVLATLTPAELLITDALVSMPMVPSLPASLPVSATLLAFCLSWNSLKVVVFPLFSFQTEY
jgi:hypothetical protein